MLARTPNPHLAFSAGRHFCLGAPLARLHREVGLRLLFERHPRLRVVSGPDGQGSVPVRQIRHSPATGPPSGLDQARAVLRQRARPAPSCGAGRTHVLGHPRRTVPKAGPSRRAFPCRAPRPPSPTRDRQPGRPLAPAPASCHVYRFRRMTVTETTHGRIMDRPRGWRHPCQ